MSLLNGWSPSADTVIQTSILYETFAEVELKKHISLYHFGANEQILGRFLFMFFVLEVGCNCSIRFYMQDNAV